MTQPMIHGSCYSALMLCVHVLTCAMMAATAGLAGCASSSPSSSADAQRTGGRLLQSQAVSLLDGRPLYAPELPADVRAVREEQLYEAQIAYDRDLHNEDAMIWLGRRQAYLGEFRTAIDTFSNGLALTPGSHRLLRHRGHRYITVREFGNAIADLERAAHIIESGGLPDEVEPDGQPNERGIPTSTSHTNIYYHLGLAHYLRREWNQAAAAYRKCLSYAKNDDMRVAATYWLFLSLMRAGKADDASAALAEINPGMDIIENHSYHRLLLVFKGELDPPALQPTEGVANDASVDLATIGYGLGVRDLMQGDTPSAQRRFRDVVDKTNWAAFGHIAAEAELAAMEGTD
jgi:tetratricopeptide (TPR) repeat protein